MRQTFKLITIFAIFSFLFFVFPNSAYFGYHEYPPSQICPVGAFCIENPLKVESFQELLNAIINFIFWLGITIAPVIFIIAGFLYVTAVGDAKRIETAKQMMLYAVIGLVVLLLARGIVAVLKSVIGVQ